MDENIVGIITLLFSYFIIALIFESAMSVIFNWRVFLEKWNKKGKKTVIIVVAASALTFSLELNIFEKLLPLLDETYVSNSNHIIETVLTALFIAGGSSGIYEVMNKTAVRNKERMDLVTMNSDLEEGANHLIESLLDTTDEKVILKSNIVLSNPEKIVLEDYARNVRNLIKKNQSI